MDYSKLTDDEILEILNNGETIVEDYFDEQYDVIFATKNYNEVSQYDMNGACSEYDKNGDYIWVAVDPIDGGDTQLFIYSNGGVEIVDTNGKVFDEEEINDIFNQLSDKDKATHLMSILEQVCEENDINITELLASELGYKQYKDDEHYIKSND